MVSMAVVGFWRSSAERRGAEVKAEQPLALGADSRFFALLGSAPQELNTVRPEAKLAC
jgi:hypothetical protein